MENSSVRDYETNPKQQTLTDYKTFACSLHHHPQQSYSTPDHFNGQISCHCFSNETPRIRTKSSESASTNVLASLLERYEKTLRERQRAFAIVNDQLLDIDDVLKHYRRKIENSPTTKSNTVNRICSLSFSFNLLCITD